MNGEIRDKFDSSYHETKEEATEAAIKGSKLANQCEWINVYEQEYRGYEWVNLQRWNGDWDGLHEEAERLADSDD